MLLNYGLLTLIIVGELGLLLAIAYALTSWLDNRMIARRKQEDRKQIKAEAYKKMYNLRYCK